MRIPLKAITDICLQHGFFFMAMNPLERIPVSGQTLFADLADLAWTGIFREVMASAGTL